MGGFFGNLFDLNKDGKLDSNERFLDFMLFNDVMKQSTSNNGGPNGNQGCYIATCVYGSYDCPQVWTLRRFRDNILAEYVLGRAFIHVYYAISPTVVKWFGKTDWFKKMWRGTLDRMVKRLNDNGVEDTPYNDREW